jgi:hypothetical protein
VGFLVAVLYRLRLVLCNLIRVQHFISLLCVLTTL